MTVDLSVITASVPERVALLNEAQASVAAQTLPAIDHLIAFDFNHLGPSLTLNRLAAMADTEWLFRLDDDDLLDRDHFEVLSKWLLDDYDIVFTWCRIEGGGEEHPPDQFQVRWQAQYGWEHLRVTNWIPCSYAVRASLWNKLGGLRDIDLEDWDFLQRALDAGARFACVPTVTWTYRMNAEWKHRNDEVKAGIVEC